MSYGIVELQKYFCVLLLYTELPKKKITNVDNQLIKKAVLDSRPVTSPKVLVLSLLMMWKGACLGSTSTGQDTSGRLETKSLNFP